MKSMTGFGKANIMAEGISIMIEIKSVNHRFLDINVRMPRTLFMYEDVIKKCIQEMTSRGHLDVFVTYDDSVLQAKNLSLDFDLLDSYVALASQIEEKYNINNDISVSTLMKFPDVIKKDIPVEDEEAVANLFRDCTKNALISLNQMKTCEGENLKKEFDARLSIIAELIAQIEQREPAIVKDYRDKTEARIRELLQDVEMDESRLLNEVAFFSDKINITEEITRMQSHIGHFRSIMNLDQVGRKLDFLVQEMNREVNTIGSKSNDIEITNDVLKLKNEIEKLREQVQNIE